jgi:hypothetical protein
MSDTFDHEEEAKEGIVTNMLMKTIFIQYKESEL